jgi:hypothetical protein
MVASQDKIGENAKKMQRFSPRQPILRPPGFGATLRYRRLHGPSGFTGCSGKYFDKGRSVHFRQSQSARGRTPLASAIGILVLCCGCLSSPPKAGMNGGSTIQVSDTERDGLWERAVVVLNRNHFQVARESKLEGIIETEYRGGSSILEPWHPDSVGFANRMESTLQSIRRRVTVNMQSSGDGLMSVNVRVDKELEDLPGLAANYEGGATFSESEPLNRDLNQVVGQSGPSRWLPIGRDPLLEQKLLSEIQGRFVR